LYIKQSREKVDRGTKVLLIGEKNGGISVIIYNPLVEMALLRMVMIITVIINNSTDLVPKLTSPFSSRLHLSPPSGSKNC
jgi:hypothetical protein